jgi:hypothetical protein
MQGGESSGEVARTFKIIRRIIEVKFKTIR